MFHTNCTADGQVQGPERDYPPPPSSSSSERERREERGERGGGCPTFLILLVIFKVPLVECACGITPPVNWVGPTIRRTAGGAEDHNHGQQFGRFGHGHGPLLVYLVIVLLLSLVRRRRGGWLSMEGRKFGTQDHGARRRPQNAR